MTAGEPPRLLFAEGRGARFLAFRRPERVLAAQAASEVPGVLRGLDEALAAGRFVAGYLAYEAAAAFGLCVVPSDAGPFAALPLAHFGVYDAPESVEIEPAAPGRQPVEDAAPAAPRPTLSGAGHAAAAALVLDAIARGDTYQVNLTFPLEAPLREDPWALFRRLHAVQPAPYSAFLDLDRFAVASVSPELFFERDGDLLRTRPMKGTAARGPDLESDALAAEALRASPKDRAENLMIVDMLRNDLGRVAATGSVAVPALFEVERYPTLLQMTSTVEARSAAPLSEVFRALFPCASVTGAPKVRTMELIAELEAGPRGVYTGALGWAGGGRARFGVAIRTAVVDRDRRLVHYGVGSGIVADSRPDGEYAESLLKGRILEERPFELLETLAFLPGEGYRRLAGHLLRLGRSAAYFGAPAGEVRAAAEGALAREAFRLDALGAPARVRLLVDLVGRVRVEAGPHGSWPDRPLRVGLALGPMDSRSPWLRHKTTRREVYDEARRSRSDCDETLLFNERGEVTEACAFNVAVERGGSPGPPLVTPPLACGLLPGVEREALLAEGRLREQVVRVRDLAPGQPLLLLNSVRGLVPATFAG